MRRGFSLVEVIVVLAVVAVLVGLALPRAERIADRIAVERETARIVLAYREAWSVARSLQRVVVLRVSSDSISITAILSGAPPDTELVRLEPGPHTAGVALQSPPHSATFGPDGIGTGVSNATHLLTRGNATRRIVVSRLGRVRVQP